MSRSFDVALVTGASSGIGAEMARRLAAQGVKVGVMGRRASELAALVQEITRAGGTAHAEAVDVSDASALKHAIAKLEQKLGPTDLLVANAGIGRSIRATHFDCDQAASIMNTNVIGLINTVGTILPGMIARRHGHIVGISSLAAYRAFPQNHVYCASKAAVSAFLEGLRLEVAPLGLHVTTICPGFIKTPLTASNTFPMPFLLECEVAVSRILKAIESRRRVYNFPRRLYAVMMLSRLLPESLVGRLLTPINRKDLKRRPEAG